MVYMAMAAIGAERCVYVGDSDVDIITAKNAGVPCLSVTWGFRDEEELRNTGAIHFCHDPKELPSVIEEILKQQ
jgi:phosphoglycolate phosphatase